MSDGARRDLVESRQGDLCVRYTVLRPALAAMALGAMSLGATAATAGNHPAATMRQSDKKHVKPRRAVPQPALVPIVLAGAPVIVGPSAASDSEADKPPPGVTWTEETPAKGR